MEVKFPPPFRHFFYLVLLVFFVLFYFYPFLFQGRVIYESDVPVVGLPTRYFATEMVKKGEFPHWNPYYYFGYPFFAESQAGVLFPLNLFFYLLPMEDFAAVYHWLTAVHFLLTGIFFYLWLMEIARSPELSLFGAFSFTFSGFAVAHLFHINLLGIMVFFPLKMWLFQKFLITHRKVYLLGIPPLIAFQVFSGNPPFVAMDFLFMFLYSLIYGVWKMFETDRFEGFLPLGFLVVCWIMGTLISAVQWVPTLVLTLQSSKVQMPAETEGYLEFGMLSLLLFPKKLGGFYYERGGYVGIFPILLLPFYAIYCWWKRKFPSVWFWLMLFGSFLALWLTLGPYSSFYQFLSKIPPYTLIRYPARFLFFFDFFYLTATVLMMKDFTPHLPGIVRGLGFLFIMVFQVRDIFWMGLGYTFPAEKEFYRDTPERIQWLIQHIQKGERILTAGFQFSPLPVRFTDYIWKENGKSLPSEFLPFYSAVRYHLPTTAFFFQPTLIYRRIPLLYNQLMIDPSQQVLDALGIRYLILPKGKEFINAFQDQYQKRYEDERVEIWENMGSPGRAYLVPKYVVIQAEPVRHPYTPEPGGEIAYKILYLDKNILNYLFSVAFEPSETVILEKEPEKKVSKPFQKATIRWIEDSPSRIFLEVDADGEGFLVQADAFSPQWKAYLDGKEVPVMVGNYVFRTIFYPGGRHRVEFHYNPWDFRLGLVVSLLGILIFLSVAKKMGFPAISLSQRF
ncbi:MAG: hypothetical protein V2G33_00330 [bacterium JZ-2024 1]